MPQFTIDEGYNAQTGVYTRVHFEDGVIVHQKTFDAEPYLKAAKAAREANVGARWGDGKTIGTLPPLVLAEIQKIEEPAEREKAIMTFFRVNPAFLHFERAIL